MDDDNVFVAFMQTTLALIALGGVLIFVFYAGGWYTQSKIVTVRCEALQMK